jgi:hydrogenase maturation protein HypF
MSDTAGQALILARISVRGVVQGVGFRPFAYGLAIRHGVRGWVCNTSEDVRIEVEGEADAVKQFRADLEAEAPPLARIDSVSVEYVVPVGYQDFEIRPSQAQEGRYQLISPDVATCQACLSELLDPADRRFRYPFTNCIHCGPRFTIIEDMPYDRSNTTMRHFQMCSQCQAEYENPRDRRFHAQPNACPQCGPRVELVDKRGKLVTGPDPVATAAQLLKQGRIVAIKGLGGFLLACDATNDRVVRELRHRKRRVSKPFAVMVAGVHEAKGHCYVSPEEERLLTSCQSPIVLLRWRDDSSICRGVAPGLRFLGIMLPYTPLHHLLLGDAGRPLVMTSGNLSEEPIAVNNDEALARLSAITDYLLVHNRDIYSGYDDSVAIVERGVGQLVRRARSYAPYPIRLPFAVRQVLGCGAQERNTFCLTRDDYAFMSQHLGDMENVEALERFEDTVSLYRRLFRIEPEIVAHDLHPDYLPTGYAQELGRSGLTVVPVQHHHAHIASCMADNGLDGPVVGVVFDGTGLGADGNVWGGEFLVADYRDFRRMGHLEYLPLPGGEAAIKRPYRTAIAYVLSLLGEDALKAVCANLNRVQGTQSQPTPAGQVTELEVEIIKRQVKRGMNSPLTSSAGRLFDAVSALLGIRGVIDYEGQAAVELEMAAWGAEVAGIQESYPYGISEDRGIRMVQMRDLLSGVLTDLGEGVPRGRISVKFHNTLARLIAETCSLIARETGITQVALSGGVFQNRLLLRRVVSSLEDGGLQVFTHSQVPCNDGGISLGQAVIASFASR